MTAKKTTNRSQRLFIELGTALRLESGNPERTVSSELIGMQVGSYLIVRLPEEHPDGSQPLLDEELQVKYLCSGEVFGFSSRVVLTLNRPDRLVFLEYPETVESFNVRSSERIECFLPVQALMADTVFNAMIVNINFQGCLLVIETDQDISVVFQDAVTIHFPMAGDSHFSIQGIIRSLQKQPPKMRIGIHFDTLDTFARSILGALIPSLNI